MIICKIIGGLGNQMFQWAYGRSISLRYNRPLFVDITGYKNQQGLTKREFQLNSFKNLKNINYLQYEMLKNQFFIIHDYFNYEKADAETNLLTISNTYLDGYWQSEKYFIDYANKIRNDFAYYDNSLQSLIEPNSISVHIRRTDYVTSNGYHPIQPISYFQLGIDAIGEYNKIYIFSDDINWCKIHLKFKNIIFMENRTGIEDMYLMSCCENNIISNSSFSWWGAWLNKNPKKKVIAPKKWFGPTANLYDGDIVPESWIKI